jgi:hypothetical protein
MAALPLAMLAFARSRTMLERGDADELARFESYIVRGPGAEDCDIWTGALSDDGYGRFWIQRGGRQRVVRPHRYALAAYVAPVPGGLVAMHRCDTPICVRVLERGGKPAHVMLGTQRVNMSTMGTKGRGGGTRVGHVPSGPSEPRGRRGRGRCRPQCATGGTLRRYTWPT